MFTNFDEIRQEIENETDRITGKNKVRISHLVSNEFLIYLNSKNERAYHMSQLY